MKRPRIHIGRPQRLAALLLLLFLGECFWVIVHQDLTTTDYRFAQCGREMWERPSPIAGYYTTCGNLNGDGTFAYRAAGLPLTLERLTLEAVDHFRSPENKLYPGGSLNGSTWETRHQLSSIIYLIHLPFVLFAVWLGGGLWWVSRRLFGNEGGFFALGLYCFCPAIVRLAVTPNNDILAAWGLYGVVYTAIGVAHAMQGPRRKWRPRILLLTAALTFTAAAHLLAAVVGFVAALLFMLYLAERNRSYVTQVLVFTAFASLILLLAFYGFRLEPYSYVFTGGGARFWFSMDGLRRFVLNPAYVPILTAAAVSLVLYVTVRRSRYFGNTAPLLMLLGLAPLLTTQTVTAPWLWALPFLFTFIGGVFADALDTRHRKLFLVLTGLTLTAQALVCLLALPEIVRG
ncbi:MAG TPA: hypothetical protein VHU44_04585 [Acidobacteriaceae bacterium]|jgi:hypothetical protein|nr:hypothetical protein [Acidobacteriaceae bacterium]